MPSIRYIQYENVDAYSPAPATAFAVLMQTHASVSLAEYDAIWG